MLESGYTYEIEMKLPSSIFNDYFQNGKFGVAIYFTPSEHNGIIPNAGGALLNGTYASDTAGQNEHILATCPGYGRTGYLIVQGGNQGGRTKCTLAEFNEYVLPYITLKKKDERITIYNPQSQPQTIIPQVRFFRANDENELKIKHHSKIDTAFYIFGEGAYLSHFTIGNSAPFKPMKYETIVISQMEYDRLLNKNLIDKKTIYIIEDNPDLKIKYQSNGKYIRDYTEEYMNAYTQFTQLHPEADINNVVAQFQTHISGNFNYISNEEHSAYFEFYIETLNNEIYFYDSTNDQFILNSDPNAIHTPHLIANNHHLDDFQTSSFPINVKKIYGIIYYQDQNNNLITNQLFSNEQISSGLQIDPPIGEEMSEEQLNKIFHIND